MGEVSKRPRPHGGRGELRGGRRGRQAGRKPSGRYMRSLQGWLEWLWQSSLLVQGCGLLSPRVG